MTELLAAAIAALGAALWYERAALHATIERTNQLSQQVQALTQGVAAQARVAAEKRGTE